jgi:hypothetical protein
MRLLAAQKKLLSMILLDVAQRTVRGYPDDIKRYF